MVVYISSLKSLKKVSEEKTTIYIWSDFENWEQTLYYITSEFIYSSLLPFSTTLQLVSTVNNKCLKWFKQEITHVSILQGIQS